MQHKFKRHQKVRLLVDADAEYVEYDLTHENSQIPIKKGMTGQINMTLPNGQYHVEVIDPESKKTIAYVPMDEESLEAIE